MDNLASKNDLSSTLSFDVTKNKSNISVSILNEAKVLNSLNKMIKLDTAELELYERTITKLNLETSLARDLNSLSTVEKEFEDLKTKIETVLKGYNGIKFDSSMNSLYENVGDYIKKMECEYLMARITHQSFNIPTVVSKLIGLEYMKEKLEYRLELEKNISFDPKKRWELSKSKEFNIREEVSKMKQSVIGQEEFINKTLLNIFSTEDGKFERHFQGVNVLTKKVLIMVNSFSSVVLKEENLIAMTVTAGIINNLLRGVKKLTSLSNLNEYINENTLIEELEYHLDDYTLVHAITDDSSKQIDEIVKNVYKDYGLLAKRNEFAKNSISDLEQSKNNLLKKEEKIVDVNKELKKNNYTNYLKN